MDIVLASSSARRIAYTSLHFDPSNSDTHPSISNMAVCISLEFLVWLFCRLGPAGSCSACTSKSSQGPHLAHDSSWEKKKLTRPVGETRCKCSSQSTMCAPSATSTASRVACTQVKSSQVNQSPFVWRLLVLRCLCMYVCTNGPRLCINGQSKCDFIRVAFRRWNQRVGWHALHSSTQLTATQMHPVTYAAAFSTTIHACI
jgi:hypothetical protein